MIPQDHPQQIVNGVIEQLDLKLLTEVYSREGCPGHHPKMMLKNLVYAYVQHLFLLEDKKSEARKHQLYVAIR